MLVFARPSEPALRDGPLPPELEAVSADIKMAFIRGMGLRESPDDIAITDVEYLPNSSYIIYLDVRTEAGIRQGAVWGHCVTPEQLASGPGGGFVTGRDDPEVVQQRRAADEPC